LRTHSRRSRVVRLWAGLAALLVVPATIGVSAPAAGATGSNTLTVKAGEYVYVLKGSPKAGWTQIDFQNSGVEDHMLVMFKLKKGVTAAQLKKALTSQDQAALGKLTGTTGDPSVSGMPGVIGPSQKTTTLTQLTAGHYGIACFVTAPDGAPHVAHGMVKVFDVSGKSNLKPPTDGVADVTLNDTAITVPPGDVPKNLSVKVTNEGTAPHSFQLVKLNEGKTLDDAYTYFNTLLETGKADGEAPAVLVGGVATVAPGGTAYLEWSLPAGNYAYLITDGDAPNTDYDKGLKGTFTIS
jgi:hypothetical protein